jgi:hypothetical protein
MQILRYSEIAITMEIYTEVVSTAIKDAQETRRAALSMRGRLLHQHAKRPVP